MCDLNLGKETDGLRPGDEVLVIGNKKEPWIGKMKGWIPFKRGEHPVITNEQGEDLICFGVILPVEMLPVFGGEELGIKEGWELAAKMSQIVQTIHRKASSGKRLPKDVGAAENRS